MLNWNKLWYQDRVALILWPLVPISYVYRLIIIIRRKFYRFLNLFKNRKTVPIIIVGNLTVGGTGKTPLVIHIVEYLIEQGWQPGIISRGYKGKHKKPTLVNAKSDPKLVGDEALLLAKRLQCPIVVGKNRNAALKKLLLNSPVDVVISDDGLQHYALDRDIEIALVDGERRFGNGYCLPAGPLREPESRLSEVDLIIYNSGTFCDPALNNAWKEGVEHQNSYMMGYTPVKLYNAFQNNRQQSLAAFSGQTVHAIAGIGNPEKFFKMLSSFGLIVIKHAFPDHYLFTHRDVYFRDEYPVIMTEKDVIKCMQFVDLRHWVLPINSEVDPVFDSKLLTLLKGRYYG